MNIIKMPIRIIKTYRENKRKKARFEKWDKLAQEHLSDFPQPELTSEEKKQIDVYWSTYGIKFKDYSWFQWYYGITGIKSPQFIPSDVYFNMLIPFYNTKEYVKAWRDKNTFERFLPNIKFPDTVIKRINGEFYDKDGVYIGKIESKRLLNILVESSPVIVKSSHYTGCGKTVKRYDVETLFDAEQILREWDDDNYIVQKVVKQHKFFSRFNSSSVNIMRIYSWYHDGKVEIISPVLRFGMPGYATDVCFIDGKEILQIVGITPEGYLRNEMVTFDGKKKNLSEIIENVDERVPNWDKIMEMIKDNAPQLAYFNIVGWDITVSENGEQPVVIEYNINEPSPYSSQMTNGPMFGEYTEQVLSFLRDKKNQEKYIPKWMRV